MLFYKNKIQEFLYADLLTDLSSREWIDTDYFAGDYPDFISNVICCIMHHKDITLIDYRNGFGKVDSQKLSVVPIRIDTIDHLINLIQNSKSQIGIYSSGTTGTPKLIYQPVSRLLKSVRIDDAYRESRWGFTYNPSHSAGIQVFLQAICNQASLYDLYKSSRAEILDSLVSNRITHLSATPTFYRMLAPYDFVLEDVMSVTFNGEKSTKKLIENIKHTVPNARLRNIYGSTESGPLMSSESTTFRVPSRLLEKVKIENNELLISNNLISNSVDQGTKWYKTGDLVDVVSEAPLVIEFVTRKSAVLNVGGQNVFPQEVEEALIAHPSVKDVRVYGRKNKLIGNLIVAEVQLLPELDVSEKELISFCKTSLTSYKVPRMIKFVEKIEIGRTGKKAGT